MPKLNVLDTLHQSFTKVLLTFVMIVVVIAVVVVVAEQHGLNTSVTTGVVIDKLYTPERTDVRFLTDANGNQVVTFVSVQATYWLVVRGADRNGDLRDIRIYTSEARWDSYRIGDKWSRDD